MEDLGLVGRCAVGVARPGWVARFGGRRVSSVAPPASGRPCCCLCAYGAAGVPLAAVLEWCLCASPPASCRDRHGLQGWPGCAAQRSRAPSQVPDWLQLHGVVSCSLFALWAPCQRRTFVE